jgi:hypothetical protein
VEQAGILQELHSGHFRHPLVGNKQCNRFTIRPDANQVFNCIPGM